MLLLQICLMKLLLSVLVPAVLGSTRMPLSVKLPEVVGTFVPDLPACGGLRRIGAMTDLSSSSDSSASSSQDERVVTPLSVELPKAKRFRVTPTNEPPVDESLQWIPKSVDSTASSDFGFFLHPRVSPMSIPDATRASPIADGRNMRFSPMSVPDGIHHRRSPMNIDESVALSRGFRERLSLVHPDKLMAVRPTEDPEESIAPSPVRTDVKAFLTVEGALFEHWRHFVLRNKYPDMFAGTDVSKHGFEHIFRLVESFLFADGIKPIVNSANCISTEEVLALTRALFLVQIVKDLALLDEFRLTPEPLFPINGRDGKLSILQQERLYVMGFSSEIALNGGSVFRFIKQIAIEENVKVARLTELIGLAGFRNRLDWFKWICRRDIFDSIGWRHP